MDFSAAFPNADRDALARFVSKIRVVGACWAWTAYRNEAGYGKFRYRGRSERAHRVAFLWAHGYLPNMLDHVCRIRSCVNPQHLESATVRENTLRGISPTAFNARKHYCPRGHEYTAENTWPGNKRKGRWCRACHRAVQAQRYTANKSAINARRRELYRAASLAR